MNLLSNLPLTDKQKEQLAQARAIKQVGPSFYSLSISQREALRKQFRQEIENEINGKVKTLYVQDSTTIQIQAENQEAKQTQNKIQPKKNRFSLQNSNVKASKPITDTSISNNNEYETSISPLEQIQPGDKFTEATIKKEALAPIPNPQSDKPFQSINPSTGYGGTKKYETFALTIELNAKQLLAAEYAEAGKSFCLTGAAGTGKTTACREIAKRLLMHGKLGSHDFKLQGGEHVVAPSIAFCSYTNRATDNIRRALHKDPDLERELMYNVVTIHKLLEYEPIFFRKQDEETGEWYDTMRFEPQRNSQRPLGITHLVIEESSMLGTDLGLKLLDALRPGCQIIYVGDINQLPPIFAKSMLNYALILLPVVELTEVYRQALESPIIYNAHRCLKGEELQDKRPFFQVVSGKALETMPTESGCVNLLVNSLKTWYNTTQEDGSKKYDPEQDIILSPFNKADAGTIVLNQHIAQFIGKQRNAMVYEILAGIRRLYLAVGDRVMVDKQDGYITKIHHNARYMGKMPKPASTELTRFGITLIGNKEREDEDIELILEGYAGLNVADIPENDEKPKKQEASHIVEVTLDNGATEVLSTAGDFGETKFSLGYALTVHKAQGCEWRKVIILLHKSHAIMLTRELLYTAITRAREYCIIVDLCNQTQRGIDNQRIKGNSIQEKIEWFNSEVSLNEPIPVIP